MRASAKPPAGTPAGTGFAYCSFLPFLFFFVVSHWVQCLKASVDNPLAPINVFGRASGWPFPLDSANGNPLASLSGTIGSWIATGYSNVLL
jgi:hypothetical protein